MLMTLLYFNSEANCTFIVPNLHLKDRRFGASYKNAEIHNQLVRDIAGLSTTEKFHGQANYLSDAGFRFLQTKNYLIGACILFLLVQLDKALWKPNRNIAPQIF